MKLVLGGIVIGWPRYRYPVLLHIRQRCPIRVCLQVAITVPRNSKCFVRYPIYDSAAWVACFAIGINWMHQLCVRCVLSDSGKRFSVGGARFATDSSSNASFGDEVALVGALNEDLRTKHT